MKPDPVTRGVRAFLAAMLIFFSHPALPATIVVDETTCTLVDAITAANTDTATGGCPAGSGADTLQLVTNVALTAPSSFSDWGDNGLPFITTEIVLEAGGFAIEREAGAPQFRILHVASGGVLAASDVSLRNGHANADSAHPQKRRGGAIHVHFGGAVTLTNTTVSGNQAPVAGGGIHNYGTLTLIGSTVSDNTTASGGSGGGIWNRGSLALTNSTVSGNTVTPGGAGGGIYNYYYANRPVTLEHSTIFGNSAGTFGGGISHGSPQSAFSVIGTIVAGNSGGNCSLAYPLAATGNDFADDGSCGAGFAPITPGVDVDVNLADNGGPTLTHALLPGSVAIDAAGDCGLATDQRGEARDDGACDSGAYEHMPPIPISSPWSLALLGAGLLAVLFVLVTLGRRRATPG